jgi:hypothetical protein
LIDIQGIFQVQKSTILRSFLEEGCRAKKLFLSLFPAKGVEVFALSSTPWLMRVRGIPGYFKYVNRLQREKAAQLIVQVSAGKVVVSV